MDIGILTYHWAPNFGAQLQTFSTVLAVRKAGHTPHVIDWVPEDAYQAYSKQVSPEQMECHKAFAAKYFNLTARCRTPEEITAAIDAANIGHVIIGSDSLFNLLKPTFQLRRRRWKYPTADHCYPNPFWGNFVRDGRPAISGLSISSQNCNYRKFSARKNEIKRSLENFAPLTTRDLWTRDMVAYFTDGKIVPRVTPDPVFSFNNSCPPTIDRAELLAKYHLPEKYILLSFRGGFRSSASPEWVAKFRRLAEREKIACVEFPRPNGAQHLEVEYRIQPPLAPLEWYYLIKYAAGYVGQLMHPIVVALHNNVPCFSFDHYGIPRLGGLIHQKKSSKIYLLLEKADMLNCYYNIADIYRYPSPEKVFHALMSHDADRGAQFVQQQSRELEQTFAAIFAACQN